MDSDLIVCLPIVLGGPDDFMASDDGHRLTEKLFRRLNDCQATPRIVVITADRTVENMASALPGIELVRKRVPFGPQSSFIEKVTAFSSWDEYLPSDATTLLFLNYRSAAGLFDCIGQAVSDFHRAPVDTMVSVVRPVDHPCQLYFADQGDGDFEIVLPGNPNTYIRKPFPPPLHLWRFEDNGQRMVNVREGKEIQGRQEHPDIFELHDAFVIISNDAVRSPKRERAKTTLAGYVIPPEFAIIYNSRLDYLRSEAMLLASTTATQSDRPNISVPAKSFMLD